MKDKGTNTIKVISIIALFGWAILGAIIKYFTYKKWGREK